jgi:adenosylcobinamide-GDP ribazoletransferase
VTALREHLNLFALALHRATGLRVGAGPQGDEESLRASDAHLPGAGWIVGIAGGLAFALVGVLLRGSGWGPGVAAVAATMVTATLTRGRGETALFRTMERLQAAGAPGQSGMGALVLMLVLAGKLGLLAAVASLSEPAVLATIFAAQVTSRLAPLLLARSLDGDVLPRAVQVGALWCALPLALLVPLAGVASVALGALAATLACYALWRLARRQAEPADRDLLASAQQVCELAFCFGVAIGL